MINFLSLSKYLTFFVLPAVCGNALATEPDGYGPTGIGVLYGKETWLDKLPPYQEFTFSLWFAASPFTASIKLKIKSQEKQERINKTEASVREHPAQVVARAESSARCQTGQPTNRRPPAILSRRFPRSHLI